MASLSRMIFAFTTLIAGLALAGPDRPSTRESSPAEKNGLSVTVILATPAFGADPQWPQLVVRFKNVAAADIHLCDDDAYWDWKFRLATKDQPGSWLLHFEPTMIRRLVSVHTLKPGETLDVPIDLNQTPRAADLVRDGIPFDQPPAPVQHLQPGKYELTVEVQLLTNAADTKNAYWAGWITTHPIVIQAQDVEAICGDTIRRVTSKFDKFGGWNSGLFAGINLAADADLKDVIAQAAKNARVITTYQILDIQPITIDPLRDPTQGAVLQTNAGVKVLIFFPFKTRKEWRSRFYDSTLTPTSQPAAATTSTRPTPPK